MNLDPHSAQPDAPATVFATKSPTTGKDLGAVEATSLEDVAGVVRRAREAQDRWAAVPIAKRGE